MPIEEIVTQESSGLRPKSERAIWGAVLLLWFAALCLVPDPRPLSAPDWSVRAVTKVTGLVEAESRVVATVVLRGTGFVVAGVLVSLSLTWLPIRWAAPVAVTATPALAIVSQWINYGYFPIYLQVQLAVASSVIGALIGLALRRSRLAVIALIVIAVFLFSWGTVSGIPDELDAVARATGQHLLADADQIPDGDEGFSALLQMAFEFAEDNSHRTDAVLPNQAAILALGVILGEERVAEVAKRPVDLGRLGEFTALRRRITLRGRNDLARHFWVSAALTVLADEERSMTVGITKELMDAAPGGSGFSFPDLTADHAGNLFATMATSNEDSARELQRRIRRGMGGEDFCPDIEGLPEGISRDDFQSEYGGLGGKKTTQIVAEIERRFAELRGLAK